MNISKIYVDNSGLKKEKSKPEIIIWFRKKRIGYLQCNMQRKDLIKIERFEVDENFQKQGLGKLMMDALFDYVNEKEIAEIEVYPSSGIIDAPKLYEIYEGYGFCLFDTNANRKDYNNRMVHAVKNPV